LDEAQKAEAVRLYTEEMKSCPEIGKLLGTSEGTIRRALSEAGVDRRSISDAINLLVTKDKGFNPDRKAIEWRLKYERGTSVKELAELEQLSPVSIRSRLQKIGVNTSNFRKYTLREDAFSGITREAAYWLGFLMADGNVSSSSSAITLSLQTSDLGHLEKWKQFLSYEGPILWNKNRNETTYPRVIVTSRQLVTDLARYGVVPRKSLIAEIRKDYLVYSADFWRGAIDGDGSIILGFNPSRNNLLDVTFVSASHLLIEQFESFLKYYLLDYSLTCREDPRYNDMWQIRVSSVRALKLLDRLGYARPGATSLDRKRDRALFALENVTVRGQRLRKKETYETSLASLSLKEHSTKQKEDPI
jgi:hypothetical protein